MNHLDHPNEITRESLVSILDIMHRLAAPEAMPELLREIIEVGKVAIVAETGVLWLLDKSSEQLVCHVESTKMLVAFAVLTIHMIHPCCIAVVITTHHTP